MREFAYDKQFDDCTALYVICDDKAKREIEKNFEVKLQKVFRMEGVESMVEKDLRRLFNCLLTEEDGTLPVEILKKVFNAR